MNQERIWYEAERFLTGHRSLPVGRRLAFEAWADRRGFDPDEKVRLWSTVKAAARQRGR